MPEDLKARVYLAAVATAGLVTLASSLLYIPLQEWQGLVIFAVVSGIAQSMPVSLFRSSAVSVSAAITFAGLLLYGPAAAVWINFGSSAVAAFRPKRKPVSKMLFNISNHALSAAVSGMVFLASGGTTRPAQPITVLLPTIMAALTYFAVQTGLIAGVIALTERTSMVKVWNTNFRWSALNFVALSLIGLGMAVAELSMGLTGIAVFSLPLLMAWYSFKLYMAKSHEVRIQNDALRTTNEKLEDSYLSTIRALAAAVDAKDHYTHGHSEMTMRCAGAIAGRLGLTQEEVAAVQIAALLHDVGKIGVPDGVLNKPSKLSDEEWALVKEHPVIGANVAQQADLLAFVVDGIRHHHERYDGAGYPNGLRGEGIPLAAQIIAVADTFQAMTSTRPYRSAYSRDLALEEIRRCAGTQFSPKVVDAIIGAMQTDEWARDTVALRVPWLSRLDGMRAYVSAN